MDSQSSSAEAGAVNEGTMPPAANLRKTSLDDSTSMGIAGPGDSPPLSRDLLNSLNDGIDDQKSRRDYRRPVVRAAFAVVFCFVVSLVGVVCTFSSVYRNVLSTENIAKIATVQLYEQIQKSAVGHGSSKEAVAQPKEVANSKKPKSTHQSGQTSDPGHAAKEDLPLSVEAKIYFEIRDSMVPMVALVSILAVAIVVILGTMLKAAFAPHPNYAIPREKEEASPLPIIEALKGLTDSIKALFKP